MDDGRHISGGRERVGNDDSDVMAAVMFAGRNSDGNGRWRKVDRGRGNVILPWCGIVISERDRAIVQAEFWIFASVQGKFGRF